MEANARKKEQVKQQAPSAVIRELKRLRKRMEFNPEYCAFSRKGEMSSASYTEEIRDNTRLYRETWILPAIDELIEWAEGKRSARELVEY